MCLDYSGQVTIVESGKRVNRSKVWEHYKRVNDEVAVCLICKKSFSIKSSSPTENLKKHLKHHGIKIESSLNRSKEGNQILGQEKTIQTKLTNHFKPTL